MTDLGSRVVQEQVGGKEDLKPDNTHSALNAVLNAINNKFEHECLDEAVRLQNTYPIHQQYLTVFQGTSIQFQACS
jgi:hypothetical protein